MLRHLLLPTLLLLAGAPGAAHAQAGGQPFPARIKPPVIFSGGCVWARVPTRESREPDARGPDQVGGLDGVVQAVLGSVIDRTLNGIGSGLEAAAQERVFTAIGATNIDTPQYQGTRCLQFWSGPLALTPPTPGAAAAHTGLSLDEAGRLIALGIYPAGRPDLFVEVWLRPSALDAYMAMTPTLMIRNASLETGREPRLERRLSLSAAFRAADSETAGIVNLGPQTFDKGVQRFLSPWQFPDNCMTKEVEDQDRRAAQRAQETRAAGPATASPGGIETEGGEDAGATDAAAPEMTCTPRGTMETAWIANPFSTQETPLSLTLTVQEIRPRNPVIGFFSGVFTDSRPAIRTAVRNEVIESDRTAADAAAATARRTAQEAAAEAIATAGVARATYCDAETPEARHATSLRLRNAQEAANRATEDANAAGASPRLSLPFSPLVTPGNDVAPLNVCPPSGEA